MLNEKMDIIKHLIKQNEYKIPIFNEVKSLIEINELFPIEQLQSNNPLLTISGQDEGMLNVSSDKTNSNQIYDNNNMDGELTEKTKTTQYQTIIQDINIKEIVDEIYKIFSDMSYYDYNNVAELYNKFKDYCLI